MIVGFCVQRSALLERLGVKVEGLVVMLGWCGAIGDVNLCFRGGILRKQVYYFLHLSNTLNN